MLKFNAFLRKRIRFSHKRYKIGGYERSTGNSILTEEIFISSPFSED